MGHDDLHVNVKYNEWKISGSQSVAIAVQMALSVIAVRQLIFQFSIEKQYPNRVYQIETFEIKSLRPSDDEFLRQINTTPCIFGDRKEKTQIKPEG